MRTAAALLNAGAISCPRVRGETFHPYNLAAFLISRLWQLRRVPVGNDERSARRYKETVKTFHERGISHGRREDVAHLGAFFWASTYIFWQLSASSPYVVDKATKKAYCPPKSGNERRIARHFFVRCRISTEISACELDGGSVGQ